MMPSPPPPPPPQPAADDIYILLHKLLSCADGTALAFPGRWRSLRAKLLSLQATLREASPSIAHPLLTPLLPELAATLAALLDLASLCRDKSLPSGRLRLQSDLDIAIAAVDDKLRDISLLVRSGVLSSPSDEATALVLPPPPPSAKRQDLALFIRDAFARVQVCSGELKSRALDSLLDLMTPDAGKIAPLVAEEGDVVALLKLVDNADSSLSLRAVRVVAVLATANAESRRVVFDEGGLGPLLRVLGSGPTNVREHAAAAIEAITADSGSAWAVSAYGGVPALVASCRYESSSPSVQALAISALRNIACIDDVRSAMVEEGAMPLLLDVLISGTPDARRSAAECLWLIASSGDAEHEARLALVKDGCLQLLLQALCDGSQLELQETILRIVHALAVLPGAAKVLCSSPLFFAQVADLVCRGGSMLSQQTAAAVIANLAPGIDDDIKRAMAPCMAPLVRMMDVAKPVTVHESAAQALSVLLTVKLNRKELMRDEKSILRLVQMLDPRKDDIGKKYPLSIILVLVVGCGNGTRRRLSEAGACMHLQKLADAEVPGAKKALQRITGSRIKNLFSIGWNS